MKRGHSSILVLLIAGMVAFAASAQAETRRAFVVGLERYSDGNIQRLSRSVTDAKVSFSFDRVKASRLFKSPNRR